MAAPELNSKMICESLKATSKKQALQEIAAIFASVYDLPERDVFDTLLERERLGTTGVGKGIAIPHGKIAGIRNVVGVFARLDRPIDFDAMDKLPLESTLKLSESMTRGDLPVILLVLTPDVVKCPNEAVAVAEPLSMLLV